MDAGGAAWRLLGRSRGVGGDGIRVRVRGAEGGGGGGGGRRWGGVEALL